jgi:phospholipid/cholesterol/gamma-HCH transport system substrate-binding protein
MKLFKRRKGGTSVLERNQFIIGAVAAFLVLGGSAGALLLSNGVFKDTYQLTANFSDAAGLKANDDLRVAGIKAGKVDAVNIVNGHVEVTMNVNSDVELPTDSRAEITVETLLGKKTVTFYYGEDNAMLADGDVIPLERTHTPIELLDLANTSVDLLEKSDAEAFQTFMNEVTKITDGKREEITSLITSLTTVAAAIDDRRDELGRLIDSLRTLGATFADKDDTLISLIDHYDVVLGNLADRTENLETLLKTTDTASHEVASLVSRNRATLNSALRGLHTTLQVVDRHQVDLAASISYLETSVEGYQSVGYSQGIPNRWANIFVQSVGPVGIDAFFGPCGTLDQALDELLGPDPRPCDERENEDGEGDGGGLPIPLPSISPPIGEDEEEPTDVVDDASDLVDGVTGDVGDLLDSITGQTGLGDDLLEGVAP